MILLGSRQLVPLGFQVSNSRSARTRSRARRCRQYGASSKAIERKGRHVRDDRSRLTVVPAPPPSRAHAVTQTSPARVRSETRWLHTARRRRLRVEEDITMRAARVVTLSAAVVLVLVAPPAPAPYARQL
jgi:hypothetical protein